MPPIDKLFPVNLNRSGDSGTIDVNTDELKKLIEHRVVAIVPAEGKGKGDVLAALSRINTPHAGTEAYREMGPDPTESVRRASESLGLTGSPAPSTTQDK